LNKNDDKSYILIPQQKLGISEFLLLEQKLRISQFLFIDIILSTKSLLSFFNKNHEFHNFCFPDKNHEFHLFCWDNKDYENSELLFSHHQTTIFCICHRLASQKVEQICVIRVQTVFIKI